MAYLCPNDGAVMKHVEYSPGRHHWLCKKDQFEASEATAARFLLEDTDEDRSLPEVTKKELENPKIANPATNFFVEGESDMVQQGSVTSDGDSMRRSNRQLGGDPDIAVKVEDYAAKHDVEVTDANIDAIEMAVRTQGSRPATRASGKKD